MCPDRVCCPLIETAGQYLIHRQMQDAAPAVGGGGGRFFGGGDRRLRPHGHHNQQAVKCPRCDSPNTKFCYYNNYNMSQPRHFCRSCRRYWTKGGVLRNVPVGGGCRKSKRSSTQAKQAEVTGPTQPDADKSSSTTSDQTTAQQEEGGDNKASVHKNDDGLVVGTEGKSTEFQLVLGGGTTSGAEEMMGFSSVVNNESTPYEDEFKAVDYDGDPGLFDLTAAVDPSYWTDQPSSLNFLP